MIITNTTNLPKPFVRMAQSDYKPVDKQYSATTLLKPVRQILLQRRHEDELEQDCSEMIWLLFGTAVHSILEKYGATESNEFTEERLKFKLDNGYTVSGVIDFYDIDKGLVVDYKTASVWKVIKQDFEDWRQQGMIYAWLLWKNGFPVKSVDFYAILKDHSKSESKRTADYPKRPVYRVKFPVTAKSLDEINSFIEEKIRLLIEFEGVADEDLPLCTEAERWNDGDKFAVMKKGRKSALRVLSSMDEAESWKGKNGGDYIETRKGTDKKCMDYCLCADKCPYYKQLKELENGNPNN